MLGKSIKKKITYFLCGLMIFATGCGSDVPEAPKLNKPVAVNESYRPVEKGDVGDIIIYSGVIVPTDYCHFYTTSIKIAEMKVSIGDYVEAGHVLGYIGEPTKYFTVEGSNLYFELDKDGTPVDPVAYFE